MISLRELADDSTTISSTRWAFASIIKFDMTAITITIVAYLVGHFLDKPLDNELINGVALLLGSLTGIITTSKALQGFEPKKDKSEIKHQSYKVPKVPQGGAEVSEDR